MPSLKLRYNNLSGPLKGSWYRKEPVSSTLDPQHQPEAQWRAEAGITAVHLATSAWALIPFPEGTDVGLSLNSYTYTGSHTRVQIARLVPLWNL